MCDSLCGGEPQAGEELSPAARGGILGGGVTAMRFGLWPSTCQPFCMKILAQSLAFAILASCQHTEPKPAPQPVPEGKHIVLGPGIYTTRGVILEPGGSITGAGMDKTTIRLTAPARLAINGWSSHTNLGPKVSDLTIDCGAIPSDTNFARCGIGGNLWVNGTVERVRITGLGSFCPKLHDNSESFGVSLCNSSNCIIKDCVVEKNTGGYVSAFLMSGQSMTGSNLTVSFKHNATWAAKIGAFAGVLQAFTLGGGSPPEGSSNIAYKNCKTTGASFGVFCDSGYRVNGLMLSNISGTLSSYPSVPKQPIRLISGPGYFDVTTNQFTLK